MDGQKQQGGEGEGEEEGFKPAISVKISDQPIKQVAREGGFNCAGVWWGGAVGGAGVNARGWGGGGGSVREGG